jgi:serine/threonine-protein kinase HipA
MTWAAAAGFDVPSCEVITAGQMRRIPHEIDEETLVYSIERFDRRGRDRIHQEDLAQVLGVDTEDAVGSNLPFGYGGLGLVMGRLLGASGLDEYLRRIALMVASGNEDAHIKNWSLVYPNGHTPCWSPIYDQLSTIAWGGGRARGPALRLGSAREWQEIDVGTIEQLAREAGADQTRTSRIVEQTLATLKDVWSGVQDRITMLPKHRQALAAHWRKVPLLRRLGALEV